MHPTGATTTSSITLSPMRRRLDAPVRGEPQSLLRTRDHTRRRREDINRRVIRREQREPAEVIDGDICAHPLLQLELPHARELQQPPRPPRLLRLFRALRLSPPPLCVAQLLLLRLHARLVRRTLLGLPGRLRLGRKRMVVTPALRRLRLLLHRLLLRRCRRLGRWLHQDSHTQRIKDTVPQHSQHGVVVAAITLAAPMAVCTTVHPDAGANHQSE
mmetsp:Transcript_76153/g.202326  ORF Transcript_76153/g.202326 Transcript_76153/m.202326 type:complete len:216 (-) Transcript_76153:1223-1870(-)